MENLKEGHWHILAEKTKNKKMLTELKEYTGQEHIQLSITQLETNAKEQDRIVKEWCNFFQNEKTSIKTIFFRCRVSQKIFDSVCKQTQLEGLWIKWGLYPDLGNIENLGALKYLHLGGGSSIEKIHMLQSLKNLRTLETSHLYKITDYSFLSEMNKIEDLLIEGDAYAALKKVKIKSLKFLEEMPQIIRLSLSMTSIDDHSYLPILKIKNLKYLELPPNDKDVKKDMHLFSKFMD